MAADETPLYRKSACEMVASLRSGEVSPLDAIDALETRWQAVDAAVNAIPTTCFDRARQHAETMMQKPPQERGRADLDTVVSHWSGPAS